MSIHPKGPGKWRIVIRVKGQKRRDYVIEGSKDDARTEEARLRIEALKAPIDRALAPNFSSFCLGSWKKHALIHFRKNTWRRVKSQTALLIEHFGDLALDEIGQDAVQAFKTSRLEDEIRPVTINSDLRVLSRILSFAKDDCGLPITPIKIRQLPEKGRSRAVAWSSAEVSRLLKAVTKHAPAILPMVVFLLNTGARKGEALALTWDKIDFENRWVRFWPSDAWTPKSNKPREATLPTSFMAWLEAHKGKPGDPVFPTSTSGGHYAFWPQKQFDEAQGLAGLGGGPHQLRHTFASMFLAKNPNIALLALVLGHEDVNITYARYTHMLPQSIEAARDVVNIPLPIAVDALDDLIDADRERREHELGVKGGKASAAKRATEMLPGATKRDGESEGRE